MANNQYSVSILVTLDTSGVKGGQRQMDDAFSQIEQRARVTAQKTKQSFEESAPAPIIIRRYEDVSRAAEQTAAKVEAATNREAQAYRKLTDEERKARTPGVGFPAFTPFDEFEKQAEAAAAKRTTSAKAEAAAAIALQRQRSAALIKEAENASKGISASTQAYDAELQRIGNLGKKAFLDITGAMGLTAQEAAQLSVAIPAIGTALLVVGGVVAGVTAELFSLTKSAAEFGADLTNLSQRTGITVQTLSTLKVATDLSGGSIQSVNTALGRYLQTVSDANHGNEEAAKKLRQVGIDYKQAFTSPDEAVRLLITRISELTNEEDRLNALRKVGVRNGQELNGVIEEINKTFGSYIQLQKTARELGLTITPEQADEAKKFENSLTLVELQFKALGYTIGREFMPDFQSAISTISNWLVQNKDEIKAWAGYVHDAVKEGLDWLPVIKDLAVAFSPLVQVMQLVIDVARAFPEEFKDVIVALSPLLTALKLIKEARDYLKGPAAPTTFDYTDPANRARAQGNLSTGTQPSLPNLLRDKENKPKGADPADKLIEQLRADTEKINKLAADRISELNSSFRAGLVGLAEYSLTIQAREVDRDAEVLAKLGEQRNAALTKRKDSATAVAKIDDQIAEERSRHLKTMTQYETEAAQAQLEIIKHNAEASLALHADSDRRLTDSTKRAAEERQITFAQAEDTIYGIQVRALLRQDEWLKAQQEIYKADTVQYQDYANKRAEVMSQLDDLAAEHADKQLDALQKDLDALQQFDQKLTDFERTTTQLRFDTGQRILDISGQLGGDPRNLKVRNQALAETIENDRFQQAIQEARANKTALMARASNDQQAQIEIDFQHRMEALEEAHQVRLQDIRLEPLYEYARKVSEIAGRVGDIFGTAFAAIGQRGKSFFQDLKDGFNNLWQQIIHDFIASKVKQFIESLFNPAAASTSGGGGIGGFFSNLFGGLFRPSATTPAFNPNANTGISGLLGGAGASFFTGGAGTSFFGSGLSSSAAANFFSGLTGAPAGQSILPAPTSIATTPGFAGGTLGQVIQGTASPTARFSLSGLGTQLGALAPLLGLTLGAGLGGQSTAGNILGGAGGLLGGLGLSAILAPESAGALGLGTIGAALGLGATATLALTFGIGGALLVGAMLLARNAARRHNETKRDQLATDIRSQLYGLINQVNSDQIDGPSALQQYAQLRAQYIQSIQGFDSKTKNNAMLWLTRDLEGQVLPLLNKAIDEQEQRKTRLSRFNPEFQTGGAVWQRFADGGMMQPFIGRVPGVYDRMDNKLIRVSGNEVVLNPSQWMPIVPYLKQVNVPGFANGGAQTPQTVNSLPELHIDELQINIDPDGMAKVIIKSNLFKKAVVHTVSVNDKRK